MANGKTPMLNLKNNDISNRAFLLSNEHHFIGEVKNEGARESQYESCLLPEE